MRKLSPLEHFAAHVGIFLRLAAGIVRRAGFRALPPLRGLWRFAGMFTPWRNVA